MVKYVEMGIVGLALFLGLGFNVFSTSSNKASVNKGIYYDNFKYTDNVVINKVDGTNIDFNGSLSLPGDYYVLEFDVVNSTSVDVHVSDCFYNKDDDFIKYELTYTDGKKINTGDVLKKGESKGIKYKVSYENPVSVDNYTFDSGFNIDYEQVI